MQIVDPLNNIILDKECFQCMSELHLALLSYKLSDHDQASNQIEELVKLIMQPMMNCKQLATINLILC